jgi:hypothetical protein
VASVWLSLLYTVTDRYTQILNGSKGARIAGAWFRDIGSDGMRMPDSVVLITWLGCGLGTPWFTGHWPIETADTFYIGYLLSSPLCVVRASLLCSCK